MTSSVSSSERSLSKQTAGTRRRRLLAAAIALACLGVLALSVDLDVARWCKAGHIPKEIMRFLNFSEVFAHGIGVATLLLTAAVLDPTLASPKLASPKLAAPKLAGRPGGTRTLPRFGSLPVSRDFVRMATTAFAGGLMANLIKETLVDRVRPRAADLGAAVSSLATFGDSIAANIASHSDANSFPSGHAATAAGFAAALSWKYPRGTWLFVALATAASAQRIASSAHYPSDVLLGAAVGLVGAAFLLGNSKPESTTNDTISSAVHS
jgi:membrane-associated phospholipid phosphatase